jgi:hypothetical protein
MLLAAVVGLIISFPTLERPADAKDSSSSGNNSQSPLNWRQQGFGGCGDPDDDNNDDPPPADTDADILFLHHSTGANLYDQGGVPEEIQKHNNSEGTSYTIEKLYYPSKSYSKDGRGNYPYDYWNLWINNGCKNENSDTECLDTLTEDYDVIIFKHCYPGADILADTGNPDISSNIKTLENYKLQYRALRDLMDRYPDTDFIVWTLVPRHRLATNLENAGRAKEFVEWVKNDWLHESGAHANIHLFDFWGHAAEDNPNSENGQVNTLKYDYERNHGESDSHPNQLANETIGPKFAQFIIDTIQGRE